MINLPKPNIQKDFILVDLDRTLIDTDALHELFIHTLINDNFFELAEIEQYRNQAAAEDRGFNIFKDVLSHLVTDDYKNFEDLQTRFLAQVQYLSLDFLMEGASELLGLLSPYHQFGILTHGDDWWQQTKLKAAGLEQVPHLITAETEKGQLIASWRHEKDGLYHLPPSLAPLKSYSAIGLIDDKAISFSGLPDNCWGIAVNPLLNQTDLVVVNNLYQVIEQLK